MKYLHELESLADLRTKATASESQPSVKGEIITTSTNIFIFSSKLAVYLLHYFLTVPLLYLYCFYLLLLWGEEHKLVGFLVETVGLLYASIAGKNFSEEELQLPIKYVTQTTLLIRKH